MKYKISKVVNSTNPRAKNYLFECWGDIRLKPAVATIALRKNKLKASETTEHLHYLYFDNSVELEDILQKVKKRVTIPVYVFKGYIGNIKDIHYDKDFFENILNEFKKVKKKDKIPSKTKIVITKEGANLLKEKND